MKGSNCKMAIASSLLLVVFISSALCSSQGNDPVESEDCVSRQEFESLKYDLHYWQNATLTIIKNNIANENAEDENCKEKIDSLQNEIQCIKDYINATLEVVLSMDGEIECPSMMPSTFPVGSFLHPAASCKHIPSSSPSGHYWIQSTSTGYATMEYCQMSPPCSCNTVPGWMRVANLDMTDPNDSCPPGFRTVTSNSKTFCTRNGAGCSSVVFPVNGVRYSKVCGKVIGYQYYSVDAFYHYYLDRSRTIDGSYVDGISLTHRMSPRSHIWTFAGAIDETRSNRNVCPCTKTDTTYTGVVPPFIDNDYFCETGSRYQYSREWYTADPLWDGEGCGATSTCCEFNSPPWFCKDLPESTTDDIELRLCKDHPDNDENIGLESAVIYIQ